jgi:hypothetical protein
MPRARSSTVSANWAGRGRRYSVEPADGGNGEQDLDRNTVIRVVALK